MLNYIFLKLLPILLLQIVDGRNWAGNTEGHVTGRFRGFPASAGTSSTHALTPTSPCLGNKTSAGTPPGRTLKNLGATQRREIRRGTTALSRSAVCIS